MTNKGIRSLQDLTEKRKKYENINFEIHYNEITRQITFRTDSTGSLIYCKYCIQTKNFNIDEDDLPKLVVGHVKDKLLLKCKNCRTIQCYDCFNMVGLDHGKYLRRSCITCNLRNQQENKPLKKCECSDECMIYIPITNRYGQPQNYARGHNLKIVGYKLQKNIKARSRKIAEYEREQYHS